jgi:hypothetical protein
MNVHIAERLAKKDIAIAIAGKHTKAITNDKRRFPKIIRGNDFFVI